MSEPMTGAADRDPALAEAIADSGEGELALVAQLAENWELPAGFLGRARIVSRFGDIATLRVKREGLEALLALPEVSWAEISRPVIEQRPPDWPQEDTQEPAGGGDLRRPEGLTYGGRGVVVGVLDWGVDFTSPAFRDESGQTRLLALWDQRHRPAASASASPGAPANRWGYGRIFSRQAIDEALNGEDPFAQLDYHPGDADSRGRGGRWRGSHGTHVLDIAAGNGRGGGPGGVAPEAELVFVHLSRTADVLGTQNLGDSASLLEAIDFVQTLAGDRPFVINMSVGAHGGPHDGSTLVERGIDRAVWMRDGRAIVNSAGNYFAARAHASARLSQDGEHWLDFQVPHHDHSSSEVEIYYAAGDSFSAEIYAPGDRLLARVLPGREASLELEGSRVGRVYHRARSRANGDRHIDLFIHRFAPGGHWKIRLVGDAVTDGRFHAWIEREKGPRPRFLADDRTGTHTTGTLCNGLYSITVGAFDAHRESRPMGHFSSAGPTRDGRPKPEVTAPGVGILAAQSTPPGEAPGLRNTRKSGTSMAAPHVAGTIALMFEAAARPLPITETRALLFASLARPEGDQLTGPAEIHRLGFGRLDVAAAVAAAEQRRRADGSEQASPEASVDPGWQREVSDLLEAAPGSGQGSGSHGQLLSAWQQIPERHPQIDSESLLLDVAELILRQLRRSDDQSEAHADAQRPRLLPRSGLPRAGDVLLRRRPAEGIHYAGLITSLHSAGDRGELLLDLVEVPYPGAGVRRAQRRYSTGARVKGDAIFHLSAADGWVNHEEIQG
ncbi:S8 family serine peptidase [Microbulbifer sp. 2201CG32-9]|uniref:S8 family serine peptidase n=1 Tax=Microbulbifer sp. 2201CG32-9 TaxID=3232309 RepID=UPI00345B7F5B